MGLNPKEYRTLLKRLTEKANTVEQKMCANEWNNIEYSKVSSIAMKNNRRAFIKHDEDRFKGYIDSLVKGETKVNAKAIFPHDITKQLIRFNFGGGYLSEISDDERTLLEQQWDALPNYMEGKENKVVVVSDVSGSMNGLPIEVCTALSLYISERNEGPFKNCVITFDSNPQFVELKEDTLSNRGVQLTNMPWGGSTNLEGTFNALLQRAIDYNVPAEEMPDTILIISDMQFNQAVRNSSDNAYEMIEREYRVAGYDVPRIIFWNVNATSGTNPVTFDQRGTALVSGFSPSILKNIMSGADNMTPYSIMMDTIDDERYSLIEA